MSAGAATPKAAGLAHELANALGSVLQLAHLSRRTVDDGSQAASDLDSLVGESERAAALLDELAAGLPTEAPVVLVIEDDDVMRGLVARTLADAGLRALEARSAEQALAVLAAAPSVALVLTDLDLPGLGGSELARAFEAAPDAPPVIVMSGASATDAPAAGVLAKPFAPDDLVRAVRSVLGRADATSR